MHLVHSEKKPFFQVSLLLGPDPDPGEPNQRGAMLIWIRNSC
jgi:hypothetical protein